MRLKGWMMAQRHVVVGNTAANVRPGNFPQGPFRRPSERRQSGSEAFSNL